MSKGGSLIKEVRIVYLKKNGRWPANGDGPRQQGPADYERVNFPPQFLTPAKQYLTLLTADFSAKHEVFLRVQALLVAVALGRPTVLHDAATRFFQPLCVAH